MPALKAGTQNRTPVFRSSDHELSPGPRDHPSPAQLNHLYLLRALIRGDPQSSVRIRGRDFCFWGDRVLARSQQQRLEASPSSVSIRGKVLVLVLVLFFGFWFWFCFFAFGVASVWLVANCQLLVASC